MFTKNIKSVLFLSKPMEIDNLFKTWIHSGNYFFATKPLNHKESLKRIGYLSTFCAIWCFRDFVAFFFRLKSVLFLSKPMKIENLFKTWNV